jgi:hypothetical protein
MSLRALTLIAAALMAAPATAEQADYGAIELTGLSRDVAWPHNAAGESYAMVCNVNGPDGFLSIRTGPGTGNPVARRLNRLARVRVDTRQRRGNWVRVIDAGRSFTTEGIRQQYKALPVSGWAHDGYLCSFIDY